MNVSITVLSFSYDILIIDDGDVGDMAAAGKPMMKGPNMGRKRNNDS